MNMFRDVVYGSRGTACVHDVGRRDMNVYKKGECIDFVSNLDSRTVCLSVVYLFFLFADKSASSLTAEGMLAC